MKKYTIVIDEGNGPKKITKIFTLSDGGFAVAVPYHNARKGHLIRYDIDYNETMRYIKVAETENYIASDRVKLSMHMNGFVQFSGENPGKILSGIDESGEPKGLGYIISPLSEPIRTGPTFGITIWGLNDFEDFKCAKANETTILFENSDIYFRNLTENYNGIVIEGFVFPSNYYSGVITENNETQILTMSFKNFEASGAVFRLKVLRAETNMYFIGLLVSRVETSFPAPSGFVLGSPSKLNFPGSKNGVSMFAMYPEPEKINEELHVQSLDYNKKP